MPYVTGLVTIKVYNSYVLYTYVYSVVTVLCNSAIGADFSK